MSSAINSMVQTNNEFNQALSKEKGNALDKDAFMLLLVTQFKYQDPLNPAEDKEFIAQLAQFSSLEQLMNLNDGMEGLTTASMQGQMISATSYIGKNVDATGTDVSKTTTDKDNNKFSVSTFRYAIGETAEAGAINVYKDGQLVNSYEMPSRAAGTYPFEWDGKSFNGTVAPDGIYRIVPAFTNAEGKAIQYDAVVDGKVNGIITESGTTYLTLEDGRTVALANIRRVSEAKTNTTEKNESATLSKVTTDTDKNEYTMSTFRYTLDEASTKGSLTVYDKDHMLINAFPVAGQSAGTYPFQWDGKDATGKVVPDGTYSVVPSFTNAAGKSISYDMKVDGSAKFTDDTNKVDNTLPDAGDAGGGTEPPANAETETAKAA